MSPASWDAIVVGGGPNGLAAAARLGAAGRRVVVLERAERLGGLAARFEFHPGFSVPGVLHDDGLIRPATVARLRLERHGLALEAPPPTLFAEQGGPGLLVAHDAASARGELARRSPHDADAYAAYRELFARLAPVIDRVMSEPPPPLAPAGLAGWWQLARPALALRKLGRRDLVELLRVAPMCVADFLNERFETPLLVEALAAPAVAATWSGPWSAGTTTRLLLHEAAPGRRVRGGPAALVEALAAAGRAAGAELRTGAEVARIRIDGGRTRGVTLVSGEALDAPVVVATCDPKRTFLGLVEPATLPLALEEEIANIRSRGTAAKLHLALSAPLELAGRAGEPIAEIRIGGGHVDELERAFDAIKYRRYSARPYLDVRIPSLAEPALAPPGGQVVSILASYAPIDVAGGWNDANRDALLHSILARLETVAPGTGARIAGVELLTPADLEARFALTGGQIHHVEPALDQLFVLRPSASTARYATPVAGLYLGGSGSHGGGGLDPGAGLLAAEAVLSRTS